MNPLVSVITVTRNSASGIAKAIDSVLSQNYRPLEYIVIDGASTDGTVDIVRSYGGSISRLISEKDSGIYFAMNKGLLMSAGSRIIFINSDDAFAHSDALSSLVGARQEYIGDDPAICYSDFIKHYPSLDRSMLMKANTALERGFALCHQAMLVDRSAYDLVGEFDTSFRYAADHDWTVRAKRAGVRFIRANVAPTVIFRHGGASHSSYRASRGEAGKVIMREYGQIAYLRYTVRQYWVHMLRVLSDLLLRLIGPRSLAALQRFYFRTVRKYRRSDQTSAG
ncbi:MAG: glycosyltransferase family 2 protein [Steroidobacteraceae bacterium]